MVVKKHFFDEHKCEVRAIHAGRAFALDIQYSHSSVHCCTVVGVHVTETPMLSWTALARDVAFDVGTKGRIYMIGDFNFVDDPLDSINFAGEPVGKPGSRAREWQKLFPGFTQLQAGLTHNDPL
eukprot:1146460-Amphidinium_carterae.3